MEFTPRVEVLKRWLLRIWTILIVAGLLVEWWKYVLYGPRGDILYFFGLSYEKNLPTWYVSSLLLVCSMLLAFIACATWQRGLPFVWAWALLSVGFAYISLDETTTIHENWSTYFDYDGVLYFGWVIPAAIIVATLGAVLAKFLIQLPNKYRWKFLACGAVYVGGAVGVELLLGYWTDIAGRKNLVYGLIDWVEESMELLGVSLFCIALVEYIRDHIGSFRISIAPPENPGDPQTRRPTERVTETEETRSEDAAERDQVLAAT